MAARALRIGTGAGFSADRLDPALDLVKRGALDYGGDAEDVRLRCAMRASGAE